MVRVYNSAQVWDDLLFADNFFFLGSLLRLFYLNCALLCRSLIKSKLIPVLGGSEEEEDADAENADPLPEKLRGSVVRSVYIWPDDS